MKNKSSILFNIVAGVCLTIWVGSFAGAQTNPPGKKTAQKEKAVAKLAKGTFEVKITPMAAEDGVGDPLIGRLALEKQFSGGLTGSSKGQMLGISTAIKDSAGYVAAERFTGTLDGKKGSFSLQHSGTMQGGKFELNVSVVPDSGTKELTGISGKMKIIIEGGKHFYEFDYTFEKHK